MGIPNNNLARTRAVLQALKAAVAAIQWTPTDGDAEAAFAKVEIYDLRDVYTALKELIAAQSRVALLVFDSASFETFHEGRDERARQVRKVYVVVADRNWGDRRKAWLGDATNPGAYELADLVVEQLRGPLADVDQVYLRPTGIEPMMITGQERQNQVGRATVLVPIDVVGGEILSALGGRTY
ncbi:MAG: hypothetical protein DVB31_02935 [Verrucomicrobia bacterium]|nr:MAG: hypothetical protein DVB31_02935 [Verrucomicrobiota bacterium]